MPNKKGTDYSRVTFSRCSQKLFLDFMQRQVSKKQELLERLLLYLWTDCNLYIYYDWATSLLNFNPQCFPQTDFTWAGRPGKLTAAPDSHTLLCTVRHRESLLFGSPS